MDETLQNLHFCPMQLGSKIWFVPPMGTPALRVSGLGWKEPKPIGFVNRPNGTGDYLLMGFHGPAEFRDSTGMHRFDGPSVILWAPSDSHYYGRADSTYVHSWLHVDGDTMAELTREAGLEIGVGHSVNNLAPLEQMVLELHAEMTEWATPSFEITRSIIDTGLRRLARLALNRPQPNLPPENLRAAKLRVDSDPASVVSVTDMARAAGLSRQHFTELFSHHFGMAPMKYVHQVRMHRAAHLLRDQNLRVSDVSLAVGFEDPFHFSRSFRKEFGVPPSFLRKQSPPGNS